MAPPGLRQRIKRLSSVRGRLVRASPSLGLVSVTFHLVPGDRPTQGSLSRSRAASCAPFIFRFETSAVARPFAFGAIRRGRSSSLEQVADVGAVVGAPTRMPILSSMTAWNRRVERGPVEDGLSRSFARPLHVFNASWRRQNKFANSSAAQAGREIR